MAEIVRPCGILTAGMDAPADFKTSVLASLDRLGSVRVLGSHEALLLGQTATGGWKRLRLPARYSWFEGLMVRAFIKQMRIGRLAILIADDFDHGRPRRLRLDCVAWYLGVSWLFPVVIWSALLGLYQDRRSRTERLTPG